MSFYPELLKDRFGKRKCKQINNSRAISVLWILSQESPLIEAINRDILATRRIAFDQSLFQTLLENWRFLSHFLVAFGFYGIDENSERTWENLWEMKSFLAPESPENLFVTTGLHL